jgi:predicted MFS family arabinose efflux permease
MRLRSYVLVTAGYWTFTLTDGALRMLVLLHFHDLGYSPASLALLFLLYEFMGIITNLVGGWIGARSGLNRTLSAGLSLQVVALAALTAHQVGWQEWVSVAFVMGIQALSGIAKDLTKLSSKSAVKLVAGEGALFTLVAALTGSKNALKGVGFFLGAALLASFGYNEALWTMAAALVVVLGLVAVLLDDDLGTSKKKPPLRAILSKSPAINRLSVARLFLFGSRDIWFVVALPVFLTENLDWSFEAIGAFLAAWVIGYGIVQSFAPRLVGGRGGANAEVHAARTWAGVLLAVIAAIAMAVVAEVATTFAVVGGLIVFGVVFAVNSSLHSFLILAYASDDEVAADVGFYYSANATGRLIGTLLSGALYAAWELPGAIWGSTLFVAAAWLLTLRLSPIQPSGDGCEITTS